MVTRSDAQTASPAQWQCAGAGGTAQTRNATSCCAERQSPAAALWIELTAASILGQQRPLATQSTKQVIPILASLSRGFLDKISLRWGHCSAF